MAVPKSNIHVNSIEKPVGRPIKGRTPFSLRNGSKRTQRHRKLSAVNPLPATADIQNVFIIPKLPTTHDAVNFLRRPMCFSVGGVGRVARANGRERSVGMMKETADLLRGHRREKDVSRRRRHRMRRKRRRQGRKDRSRDGLKLGGNLGQIDRRS